MVSKTRTRRTLATLVRDVGACALCADQLPLGPRPILQLGFCFPGTGRSGDLLPRAECAPAWREALLSNLDKLALTNVLGRYALAYHLPDATTLTAAVQRWEDTVPLMIVLPYPSPHNGGWFQRYPWFDDQVLPVLRRRVAERLQGVRGRGETS